MPPTGATDTYRSLTVDGISVEARVYPPTLGVDPRGRVKWSLTRTDNQASLGTVWECPDGAWRTWRHGEPHATLELAAAELLGRGSD